MNLDAASPCGLIANELVTNAFKHAFPEPRPRPESGVRKIVVAADQNGDRYTLTVFDNGVELLAEHQWLKRVDDLVYQVKREGRDHISHRR